MAVKSGFGGFREIESNLIFFFCASILSLYWLGSHLVQVGWFEFGLPCPTPLS